MYLCGFEDAEINGPEETVGTEGPVEAEPPFASARFAEGDDAAGGQRRSGRGLLILTAGLLALAALLGGMGFWGCRALSIGKQCANLIDEAEGYVRDGRYEKARDAYRQALKLDEGHAQAILGLADACIRQGEFDDAQKMLDRLTDSGREKNSAEYEKLKSMAEFEPELQKPDAVNFPHMAISLAYGGERVLTQDAFTVTEGDKERPITDFQADSGTVILGYETEDTDATEENRTVTVALKVDDYAFAWDEAYQTPRYESAQVRLVSADVSKYPVVEAYFCVEDENTGEALEGLDARSFRIRELRGGEYLSREVRRAELLEDNAGLNIGLVADKSSSIASYDMDKIKQVMTDFVHRLNFKVGDKAEVLAFDSVVQQMCSYTEDEDLLVNGIGQMSTDGSTAFYDAVYDGIRHAALQGGARCVIAFTDGIDNMSLYNASQVIQHSIDSQVPVYVIGVGYDVEESILRDIADSTGGKYWFIDDLYELQQIFDEIYTKQQKLYKVEYVSDESQDAYSERDLEVTVSGGGYKGKESANFRAARSVASGAHDSRYEFYKEPLTWQEAARRCQEMGGHLATVTSQSEMDEIIRMANAQGADYVWLGGYTSYDDNGNVFGHWLTGEGFSYSAWAPNEPSRVDLDGIEEWYIMLWNIAELGGWSWNDQRNDPIAANSAIKDRMGFVCEYDE